MFIEYENPTINGCMVLVVKSRGNRRIYIAKTILNLRTLIKLVEQRIEGLEEVMDVITLALGSRPRQGFARLRAKKGAGSHTTYSQECERV